MRQLQRCKCLQNMVVVSAFHNLPARSGDLGVRNVDAELIMHVEPRLSIIAALDQHRSSRMLPGPGIAHIATSEIVPAISVDRLAIELLNSLDEGP